MSTYYLKTKDISEEGNISVLFEIQKYIKEKYKIKSSIVKREYIKGVEDVRYFSSEGA